MSGNNGCPNDENEYERVLRERDEAYRYIVDHSTTRDHACASCYPHSDCLVPGFVCLYHRARIGLRLDEVLTPFRQGRADAGHCMANRDGDCAWSGCPQLRDGEPARTGRHCPRDRQADDETGP